MSRILKQAATDIAAAFTKYNLWKGGGGGGGGGSATIERIWYYIDNNGGKISYGTSQNYTLQKSIDNFDVIYLEFISSSGDIHGNWNGTSVTSVLVENLKSAWNANYFNYTSYDNRSSRWYLNGKELKCTTSNVGNTNGLVSVWGVKY